MSLNCREVNLADQQRHKETNCVPVPVLNVRELCTSKLEVGCRHSNGMLALLGHEVHMPILVQACKAALQVDFGNAL